MNSRCEPLSCAADLVRRATDFEVAFFYFQRFRSAERDTACLFVFETRCDHSDGREMVESRGKPTMYTVRVCSHSCIGPSFSGNLCRRSCGAPLAAFAALRQTVAALINRALGGVRSREGNSRSGDAEEDADARGVLLTHQT